MRHRCLPVRVGELRRRSPWCSHGDRTPKQKLKVRLDLRQPKLSTSLLQLFEEFSKDNRYELKLKNAEGMTRVLDICREGLIKDRTSFTLDLEEDVEHLSIAKSVLEHKGHFAGINRKVQLKPEAWDQVEGVPPSAWRVVAATFVLKWGGELTDIGCQQAAEVGHRFRCEMYPGEAAGLLRLHSTYRCVPRAGCCRETPRFPAERSQA